jgi:hypothetical protein
VGGPSGNWWFSTALLTLIPIVVLAFDGVYWPLLGLPLVGYGLMKAMRARQQ